jgi:hypothetical protein
MLDKELPYYEQPSSNRIRANEFADRPEDEGNVSQSGPAAACSERRAAAEAESVILLFVCLCED